MLQCLCEKMSAWGTPVLNQHCIDVDKSCVSFTFDVVYNELSDVISMCLLACVYEFLNEYVCLFTMSNTLLVLSITVMVYLMQREVKFEIVIVFGASSVPDLYLLSDVFKPQLTCFMSFPFVVFVCLQNELGECCVNTVWVGIFTFLKTSLVFSCIQYRSVFR